MGWFIAWLLLGIFLSGVSGVGFPVLYGFFMSTVIVGSMWLGVSFLGLFIPTKKRPVLAEKRNPSSSPRESYEIDHSALAESVISALLVIGAVLLLPFAVVFDLAKKSK